ncbi:hypothetical protein FOA52_006633 [Chlamydomonas sp. UWO 241]|nr:hypothetical protein FOA52_006633 [Chlamydomonas sp. UWO 241]
MLPSYAGGKGAGGRHGHAVRKGSSVLTILLALLVLGLGAVCFYYHRKDAHHKTLLKEADEKLAQWEVDHGKEAERARQQKAAYQHCESQFHSLNKQLMDTGRRLREAETGAKDATNCQREKQEAIDKLAYEKGVNEAMEKHVRGLEHAHSARESDWHELAAKWKQYEEDAIKENHRLLMEMTKAKNPDGNSTPEFNDPKLPDEEPKARTDSKFDAGGFKVPEYVAPVHPDSEWKEAQHRPTPEVQGEPQVEGTAGRRMPNMRHHDHIYDDDPSGGYNNDQRGPTDEYWVGDGAQGDTGAYYDHGGYDNGYEWPEVPAAPAGRHEDWERNRQAGSQGAHPEAQVQGGGHQAAQGVHQGGGVDWAAHRAQNRAQQAQQGQAQQGDGGGGGVANGAAGTAGWHGGSHAHGAHAQADGMPAGQGQGGGQGQQGGQGGGQGQGQHVGVGVGQGHGGQGRRAPGQQQQGQQRQ